tara:strand:- start:2033 stop:2533 length:501 start_codon:yes stop_codon:yes gene_type:complete
MAKIYFDNLGENTCVGISELDENKSSSFTSQYEIEISNDILNDIRKDKKLIKNFDGTNITYEDKLITPVSEEIASQINEGNYLGDEGFEGHPFSENDFRLLVENKIQNLQKRLEQKPSHPLKNAAESYITSLQNIDYDSITWPLSKFVGEYCSENSITIVHELEII